MAEKIRVVHVGLGPIGASLVRLAAERSELSIVGAVDVDPGKVGKDLAEVADLPDSIGVEVESDLEAVLARTKPSVVVHATLSALDKVAPQLEAAIKAGVNVVSTCEEMAFPYKRHPELSARLDALAKEHGVTVLGTGVNPGYAMDTLALVATSTCHRVDSVTVNRIQDAAPRRLPLQLKIGAGLTLEEFERKAADGSVRHVGLSESALMIADTLGWELDEIDETIEPFVAKEVTRSQYLEVQPGHAVGVHQVLVGRSHGREVIRLNLEMYLGPESPRDEVIIEGFPAVHLVVEGGLKGDPATSGIIINAVSTVANSQPGLMTMRDVAPVHSVGSR